MLVTDIRGFGGRFKVAFEPKQGVDKSSGSFWLKMMISEHIRYHLMKRKSKSSICCGGYQKIPVAIIGWSSADSFDLSIIPYREAVLAYCCEDLRVVYEAVEWKPVPKKF